MGDEKGDIEIDRMQMNEKEGNCIREKGVGEKLKREEERRVEGKNKKERGRERDGGGKVKSGKQKDSFAISQADIHNLRRGGKVAEIQGMCMI